MAHFEYKIVPAPKRGEKVRGVRGSEDRFALALAGVMNAQAALGWEYQRTETLPSEERDGLLSKTTVFQNMMVFRRTKDADVPVERPVMIEDHSTAPDPVTPVPVINGAAPVVQDDPEPEDASDTDLPEQTAASSKPPLTAQR